MGRSKQRHWHQEVVSDVHLKGEKEMELGHRAGGILGNGRRGTE